MARLAIVGSFSVNGVAKLHSDILAERELKDFAQLYPSKFNNKTNGITHRRWLAYCNPELSSLISEYIGDEWIKHPERLEDLMGHLDDLTLQDRFLAVKKERKQILADYIKEHNGFIFGAKAASGYYSAKKVIKLINSVGDVVNNDSETNKYLKVVFLENYGVTLAEKIMPAADVSEQISTAGKEASGTGNMKFMMNGAITLGTLDGANVEIAELVGEENCVIFGMKDHEVKELQMSGAYKAWDYYNNNPRLKRIIDSLMDGTFHENREEFRVIFEELMNKNHEYFVLADYEAYCQAQSSVRDLYKDRSRWAKVCLTNIAKSGFFSSDRTIQQYVDDIWHLDKVKF